MAGVTRSPRRATWLIRTGWAPLLWFLAAAASFLVGLLVDVDGWLPLHLLLLGAVSNVILVWSAHFTNAVLRRPTDDHAAQARRLVLFNAGALLVVAGTVYDVMLVIVVGGVTTAVAIAAHALWLLQCLRGSLPARFSRTVGYYIAAACLLLVGIVLGLALEGGVGGEDLEPRLLVAHLTANLVGWISLTVVGTLVTLWPTMLRTPMGDAAETAPFAALPWFVAAVIVSAAGVLLDVPLLAAGALVGFVVVLAVVGRPSVRQLRAKPPREVATWSVLAGVAWFVAGLMALAVAEAAKPDWDSVVDVIDRAVRPALVGGFAVQVVVGALSYLVPVMLGGGPASVRASIATIERFGRPRVAVLNVSVLLVVLGAGPLRAMGLAVAIGVLLLDIALLVRAAASRRPPVALPAPPTG